MEDLKTKYNSLKSLKDKTVICTKLKEIMALFLQNYFLEVNNKKIEPIEVEAYYFNLDVFEDKYMHCDVLQKNHFANPYFHKMNNTLKTGNYKGMDICLSDSDDAYFSLLIRSASIDGKDIYGPSNCVKEIFGDDSVYKKYYECEQKKVVLKRNEKPKTETLHYGARYGLAKEPDSFTDWKEFFESPLRMVKGEFYRLPSVKIKKKKFLKVEWNF